MSYPGPGAQPTALFVDGAPVSGSNPLPITGGGGGGGTVDQGTAGSALQSWYVRDGSGLLATAAKQDTGNTSLASILGQLDSKTSTLATTSAQTTGNNSLSSIDTKLSAFSSGTSTISSVNCTSAANLFESNSSAKSRWIYNPVGNGTLYVRLGSGSHTGAVTSSFPVEGGQFICIFPLDYKGVVQGLLAAGSQTIQATEVA